MPANVVDAPPSVHATVDERLQAMSSVQARRMSGVGTGKGSSAGAVIVAVASDGGGTSEEIKATMDELAMFAEFAVEAAKARVSELERARISGLAELKEEMAKLDVNELAVGADAGELVSRLHNYEERLTNYDKDLRDAEIAVDDAQRDRSSLAKAIQLQQRSAQMSAMAQRSTMALQTAKSRHELHNEASKKAAEEAATAAEKLRASTSATLHPSPDALRALRQSFGDHQDAYSVEQEGGSPLRLPLGGAPAAAADGTMWSALLALETRDALPLEERLRTAILETVGDSGHHYGGTAFGFKIHQIPRRWAILLVEDKRFDTFILCSILANCAQMAWESPLDPEGTYKAEFIDVCEWVFLGIFTTELLSKVLAYGLLFQKGAYLYDPWCQLDFVVVSLAWLPIIFPEVGNFSALRAFRALRPLRALRRVPGMPVLVQWILDVLPKMGNVLMLCGFILLVFGIVGMETFKGSLHYRCAWPGLNPDDPPRQQEAFDIGITCSPERPNHCGEFEGASCEYFGANPHSGTMSFDSIALASIALVQGFTLDDWASPMYALENSLSTYVWIYFVLIVLLGGFFVVNLFLAVIFLEFGASRKRIEVGFDSEMAGALGIKSEPKPGDQTPLLKKGTELSDTIAELPARNSRRMSAAERAKALTPEGGKAPRVNDAEQCQQYLDCYPNEGSCRDQFAIFLSSSWVSGFTTSLVIVNMVLMCMPFVGMSPEYAGQLESYAEVITWVFIGEMILKLFALGCVTYWEDGWNCLDGSIVLLSVFEIIMDFLAAGTGVRFSFLRMLRMLRVLRILRLMRTWRGLYEVVSILLRAAPQMANIVFLILIFIFMFSLIGMQLFGGLYNPTTGYSLEPCPGGACPDASLVEKPYYHFDYCFSAMVTTFVLITGEWVQAMQPAATLYGPWVGFFFIPTVMIGKYLLLNLLVAVILVEFQEKEEGPKSSRRSETDREQESVSRARALAPIAYAWPRDYSMCLFAPNNCVRTSCQAVVASKWFDRLVLVAIIISSICLAIDTPRVEEGGVLAAELAELDIVFTSFFFLEMCLKIVSMGFVCAEGAYLHTVWNQLDFCIVWISVLVIVAEEIEELRGMRVLRVLRVLRPLRLISQNDGMKLIVGSLFKALPAVSNVLGVVMALQIVFAILGLQLFMGEMGSCDDPSLRTQAECEATLQGGQPLVWSNPAVGSFDDFGSAMRLLYIMSTGDDWAVPMFTLMGAVDVGVAPVRNDFALLGSLYSIVWMCASYVFAINLFVGVVVDNFARIQREESNSATMTVEQQQWVNTIKALTTKQPSKALRPPIGKGQFSNTIRRFLFRMVTSKWWDSVTTLIIVINVGVMACDYYGIEDDPTNLRRYEGAMIAFNAIYYLEFAIKIGGLGAESYFEDAWCRFDFFLVCTMTFDMLAEDVLARYLPLPPMLLRTLRVIRIVRVLRLLKSAKGLRDLLVTMILSLPSLLNVSSLLALIIYIYAILGVQLFTFLAYHENLDGINDERNFKSMSSASLLLFQCLTGDGWSDLMVDSMLSKESGECSAAEGNCGSPLAVPYFISFQVVGSFIFLNLVVAVILENFAMLHNINPRLVNPSDLEVFLEAWADFDPEATSYISFEDLPKLLLKVPRPLGVKGSSISTANLLCMHLGVTQHRGGLIAYNELLSELLEFNYFHSGGVDVDELEFKEAANPLEVLERQPLPDGFAMRFERNALVRDAAKINQAFAYRTIAEAAANWRKRKQQKARQDGAQGKKSNKMNPNWTEVDNGLLGRALGAREAGALIELPPSMDVDGGKVVKLGWLKWNGEKRWVKVGMEALELWNDHSELKPALTYSWAVWGVLSIDLDYNRSEPAMIVVLVSKVDPDAPNVLILLQAYIKESEASKEERQAHLRGFLDECKLHAMPGSKVRKFDLTKEILAHQGRAARHSHTRVIGAAVGGAARVTGTGLLAAVRNLSPSRTPSRPGPALRGSPTRSENSFSRGRTPGERLPESGPAHLSALGLSGETKGLAEPSMCSSSQGGGGLFGNDQGDLYAATQPKAQLPRSTSSPPQKPPLKKMPTAPALPPAQCSQPAHSSSGTGRATPQSVTILEPSSSTQKQRTPQGDLEYV